MPRRARLVPPALFAVVCATAPVAAGVVAEFREVERPLVFWNQGRDLLVTRLLEPSPGHRHEAVWVRARVVWGEDRGRARQMPFNLMTSRGGKVDVLGVLTPFGIYEGRRDTTRVRVAREGREAESEGWIEVLYEIAEGEELAAQVGEERVEPRRTGGAAPAREAEPRLEARIESSAVEEALEVPPSRRAGAAGVALRHWSPGRQVRRVVVDYSIRSEWQARSPEAPLRAGFFHLRTADGRLVRPWGVVSERGVDSPMTILRPRAEAGGDGGAMRGRVELLFWEEAGLEAAEIGLISAAQFEGEGAR